MQKLRHQIFAALGFAGLSASMMPACGGVTEAHGGSDADSDTASGSANTTGDDDGGATTGTTGQASGTTDGTGGASTGNVTTATTVSQGGNVSVAIVSTANSGVPCVAPVPECFPHEEVREGQGLGAAGAPPDWSCPASVPYATSPAACGSSLSSATDTECCYWLTQCCLAGRPYTVDGQARVAPSTARADWLCRTPSADQHPALAQAWLQDALFEHASVAAFARLTLELLALGAPPDLVRAATAAAGDEIVHAQLCFGLAARYSPCDQGPGPLTLDTSAGTADLTELTVATVIEGCVLETVAAALAAEQYRLAEDPAVRAALEIIQRDEARHAELAYRIVSWALAQGGAPLKDAVRAAFVTAMRNLPTRDVSKQNTSANGELNAHGRLSQAQKARVTELTLRQVIEPAAALLLDPPSVASSSRAPAATEPASATCRV